MASDPLDDRVKIEEGPVVNGKPTTISMLTAQQLKTSKLLPGIFETINAAFRKSHSENLGILSPRPRLSAPEEFLTTMTDDPEAFAIIQHQDRDGGRVLTTAVCRRYRGVDKNIVSPWLFEHEPDAATEEWELKLLASHPTAQGKGLASYMLKLAEQKVTERYRVKVAKLSAAGDAKNQHPARMRMIFSTPKQLHAEYYARRGYKEDYSKPRGEGFDFDIVFMSKVLAVES